MGIIRDSFVIFKNWAEAINTLPDEYQLETYKALVEYGTTGTIPEDISAIAHAMLVSFKVGMENSICRYAASVENGKKGGNPNFKKGQPNPYYVSNKKENKELKNNKKITKDNLTLPTITETLPPYNLNVNDNVNRENIENRNNNRIDIKERVESNNMSLSSLSTSYLSSLLEILPNLTIDCQLNKNINISGLIEKIKESSFIQKNFTHLSKIIKNYDKIMSDYYKDFEVKKSGGAPPPIIKHNYTEDDFKKMYFDINELSEQ